MKLAVIAAALALSAALISSSLIFEHAVREETAGREQLEKEQATARQNWVVHRTALIGALRKVKTMFMECTKNGRTDDKRLLPLLESVDTSLCPEDFRLAWYDLMTACEKQKRDKGVGVIEGLATLAAWAGGYGEVATAFAADTAHSAGDVIKDDLTIPTRAVGRCFIKYNITAADLQ
jgi:hypothetical protein